MATDRGVDRSASAVLPGLVEGYIGITARSNPGRTLRWGRSLQTDGAFSPETVDVLSRQLERTRADVAMLGSQDVEVLSIAASVRERLYELTDLAEWRFRPHYFVEKHAVGLIEMLAWNPGLFPEDALRRSISNLPNIVQSALDCLDFDALGRVDCTYSAHRLRDFRTQVLSRVVSDGVLAPEQLSQATGACRLLEERLANLPDSNPLTVPLGPETLREWVVVHSGITIEPESLAAKCVKAVQCGSERLTSESSAREQDAVLRGVDEVRAACAQLAVVLGHMFTHESDVLEALMVRPLVDSAGASRARAEYLCVGDGAQKPRAVLHYRADGYGGTAAFESDLVHEVYPGHHWERLRFWESHKGKVGCSTYESYPYLEGWACYCQQVHAEIVGGPALVSLAERMEAVLALKALAVLRTHGIRSGISRTAQELGELAGLTKQQATSLAMEAYLFPLQLLSPMVGLLALRRVIGNQGTAEQYSAITRRGPTVLWGVCV